MAESNRLGKGLGAIFGDDISSVLEDIQQGTSSDFGGTKTLLSIESIRTNPYQPRRVFDEEKLNELAQSIQTHGLFTPILVRQTDTGYELVAGERRLRASKQVGLEEISAIIVDFDDEAMMEIAILENVQREDLNVIEEAMGYKLLIDRLNLTQDSVAKRMSKSRSHVTNLLRLLRLPDSVQNLVSQGKLTMGHVRPLITIDDNKLIEEISQEIIEGNMSVREAERYIKKMTQEPTHKEVVTKQDYSYAVSLFQDKLQTRVKIESGSLNISFSDDDDLNRIMELLNIIE